MPEEDDHWMENPKMAAIPLSFSVDCLHNFTRSERQRGMKDSQRM
jgi:hypothetical protein